MFDSLRIFAAILVGFVLVGSTRSEDKGFTIRAFSGSPFGVAELLPNDQTLKAPADSVRIDQLGAGALYPAKTDAGCRFLFDPTTTEVTFRGKAIPIIPEVAPSDIAWKNEQQEWWTSYRAQARAAQLVDTVPLQLDQYLMSMLARRLKLEKIDVHSQTYFADSAENRFFALLTGAESIRVALQKETLLQTGDQIQKATLRLPKPVLPPAVIIPEPRADVEVEPIAMMVPPELFYARLASYQDLTWARQQVDQLGTDVRDFLNARAFDYALSPRLQDQLELHDSAMAQLLGPHVIDDIAIIGTDTFLREGAGIGVLFHAKNNVALSQNLNAQRAARQMKEPGATLKEVTLKAGAGKHSFLSTPDNRLRSFYVQSGDYHLVTTSRHIAQQFLDVAGKPEESLGALKEFRYARTVMPLSRKDQVFIHLSDPFFRSFIHPRTRIEMTRRAKSDNEMELLEMATLAAKGENRPAGSIEELVAGGFLPSGFGQRPDGSSLLWDGTTMSDSLRGGRGSFLPLADVDFDSVTKDEVDAYSAFSQMYARIWQRMDPASVAIARVDEGDKERIVVDLHVCPFPIQDYWWLGWFEPETDGKQLAPIDNAVLVAEGEILSNIPAVAGVLDFDVDPDVLKSMASAYEYTATRPVFVGNRSKEPSSTGFFGAELPDDLPDDTVKELGGPWFNNCGMRSGGFTFWAEEKETLLAMAGKIREIDAARPAKARVHVYDVKTAKSTPLSHVIAWLQARKIADGNLALLNKLARQFNVDPEKAPGSAQAIFDATLVHPLSGQWAFTPDKPVSDVAAIERMDYRQPLLNRLRGAEFEVNSEGNVLTTHIELLLDKPGE